MYQTVTIAELRLQYEMEQSLLAASPLRHLFGSGDPIDGLTPITDIDDYLENLREAHARKHRKDI